MPRVWNKREPNIPTNAVYVGRPTKWGNIYSHIVNSSAPYYARTREEAINKYSEYLHFDPEGRTILEAAKIELKGKDLVCWCAPLPCHADILLEIANNDELANGTSSTKRGI